MGKIDYLLKALPDNGRIVYEYNPLLNYRLDHDVKDANNNVVLPEGSPTDLITDYNSNANKLGLNFDLNHPVDIQCLASYDGSVNLILNDNKNIPRLINTRFSTLLNNTYEVVDREGSNDTNLYDEDLFDTDTSLYKRVNHLPKVSLVDVSNSGSLLVGNYVFYFTYADADDNETDFVAESGLVSCFIGLNKMPSSINGGYKDLNSLKAVTLSLTNIDRLYDYLRVYYSRASSDTDLNIYKSAYKIVLKYPIISNKISVTITGNEDTDTIPLTDLNVKYFLADTVKTQAACQNRLFFGNISSPTPNHKELKDLSLRITPFYSTQSSDATIGKLTTEYRDNSKAKNKYRYYNVFNIYNSVGYWSEEIYRFGIVYIMKDGSLSSVYNVLGVKELSSSITKPSKNFELYNGGTRNYLEVDEENYMINNDINFNAKGVCRFPENISFDGGVEQLISIKFGITEELYKELSKYAFGFFFVRLKRIPTIIALGWTLAMEEEASVPLIPLSDEGVTKQYIERFLTDKRLITHDYASRLYPLKFTTKRVKYSELSKSASTSATMLGVHGLLTANPVFVFAAGLSLLFGRKSQYTEITVRNTEQCQVSNSKFAIICPEYELNQALYNQVFTGTNFPIKIIGKSTGNCLEATKTNKRLYGVDTITPVRDLAPTDVTIAAIPDSAPVVIVDGLKFRAYLGEAEDASKFRYIGFELRETEAHNLVRGVFGPYLGCVGRVDSGLLVNIYTPGYNSGAILSYFKERYEDNSEYLAISDRFEFALSKAGNYECFRGDCFLCNFTHRLNRNFQDPTAPTNDIIIELDTWSENYDVDDREKTNKINRGDINAVKLGSWFTFPVRTTRNISLRSTDLSFPTEEGMFGHPRGFYPLQSISVDGDSKIADSSVFNGGFGTTLSERWNYTLPASPYFKNVYQTRIAYSDVSVGDAFKNGYRVFNSMNYRDYPRTYGGIMKILDWLGNLLVVFEHAIALIPINERVVAGNGDGGDVFINTNNVLPENPKILTDMFGSLWPDSVIKTSLYIYGVDTVAKKIWRTDGNAFACISDFKVQKFLNDNITLGEFEMTPIIGVRNVKTHYNAFKLDVMFTYYDHTKGLHETVWNLCFNEIQEKFITFYSWVPSFSENIDNIFFSFDRDTSKKFAKLATSNCNDEEADGITLEKTSLAAWTVSGNSRSTTLTLTNRYFPNNPDLVITYNYTLEKDLLNYSLYFSISGNTLTFTGDINNLPNIFYLNITCKPTVSLKSGVTTHEDFVSRWNNQPLNIGTYESVVAISKDSSLGGITTAFWRHGLAGLLDRADKIKPTTWYGKTHPFEFEVIVADKPSMHKIFNNLRIMSNKAEPESFHYEVVGEVYDFNWDKKNMYYRQEATKAMFQSLGSDIAYDYNYLQEVNDSIKDSKVPIEYVEQVPSITKDDSVLSYKKSTLFPLTYMRLDSLDTIEHDYKFAPDCCVETYEVTNQDGKKITKQRFVLAPEANTVYDAWKEYRMGGPGALSRDYEHLAGAEITYDKTLNEFKVWNHAKACNVKNPKYGRLRGNMNYLEDMWDILINPIIFVEKNEKTWTKGVPPIAIVGPLPNDVISMLVTDNTFKNTEISNYSIDCIDTTTWGSRKETKPRDKYLRVRVRYSGKDLAVINSLITQYTISYA